MPAIATASSLVGRVAADADRTDQLSGAVADEHAARNGNKGTTEGYGDGADERRLLLRPRHRRSRPDTEPECTEGLPAGNGETVAGVSSSPVVMSWVVFMCASVLGAELG